MRCCDIDGRSRMPMPAPKTVCLPWQRYRGGMVQSWGISKFNGQLSTLEASIARAGAALACALLSGGEFDPSVIRARRGAGMFDLWFFAQMRVILCATAVSALAVLILMLL
jgi:hypothetical protein